jgi:WD40 repeat protein
MPGVTASLAPAKTELRPRYRIAASDYVAALEVALDGSFAAAGLGDGGVFLFDARTGSELASFRAHAAGVLGVSLAPASDRFVTCGQDAVARLWSSEGALLRELPGGTGGWVEHVAWSPTGDRLVTTSGKRVRIWSAGGDPIVETEPLESTVTGLAWRADGNSVAASCYGGVHVLPVVDGAKARHFAWKGSLVSIAWSPDAKVIACGSQDCSVHFWRVASGHDSEMSGYPFKPKALAWDGDSKLLATSGHATITTWDFRGKGPEGTRPILLEGHQGAVTHLAFHPRKGLLASGAQDTSVLLWEPRRGVKPTRFAFLDDEITGLAWCAAHPTLIASDGSGTIAGWEIA